MCILNTLKDIACAPFYMMKWSWEPLAEREPMNLMTRSHNGMKIGLRAALITASLAACAVAMTILFGALALPIPAIIAGVVASAAILAAALSLGATVISGIVFIPATWKEGS